MARPSSCGSKPPQRRSAGLRRGRGKGVWIGLKEQPIGISCDFNVSLGIFVGI